MVGGEGWSRDNMDAAIGSPYPQEMVDRGLFGTMFSERSSCERF